MVSPHLDDAVLSCGHLLLGEPDPVVATVFAGHPGAGVLSDWDRSCGFVDGDDPVARRRDEDRNALALLGARPWHMDFLDLPYRDNRTAGGGLRAVEITRELAGVVEELGVSKVFIPVGILHPDHVLTHEAGALLLQSSPLVELWMYRDLPYGLALPHLVTSRLENLRRSGLRTRPVSVAAPTNDDVKRAAVACYPSQGERVLSDLGRAAWELTCSVGGEQFWQLAAA